MGPSEHGQRGGTGLESDLPVRMGNPARRALIAAGYVRLEQVAGIDDAELLKLHGVGPKGLAILRKALAEWERGRR